MSRFANTDTHYIIYYSRTHKTVSSNITSTFPSQHQTSHSPAQLTPRFALQITSIASTLAQWPTTPPTPPFSTKPANLSPPRHQTESTSQAHSAYDPTEANSSAPASIASLLSTNPTYTSETDSPFTPVFFSYAGDGLPSAEQFSQCLSKSKSHSASREVEELSVKDFDRKGETIKPS